MHPDLPWCRYVQTMGRCTAGTSEEVAGTQGRAASTIGRMPPRNASDENQDRLLQGREPQRQVSEYSIPTSSDTAFGPGWFGRPRDNTLFWGFNPAVSASALKAMRAAIRELNLRHRT